MARTVTCQVHFDGLSTKDAGRRRMSDYKQPAIFPRLNSLRRWRSPESLLLPIGAEIAKLICEEDFEYVKACEGSTCTLLYVDRTRGRARRWCSMAICGHRAKQVAHCNRRKA